MRSFTRIILLQLTVLSYIFIFSCTPEESTEYADVIISGGPIYTMDEQNMMVEAVAVTGNRIVLAGTMEEAGALQGENTKMIDLDGKTMTPGFIEGHGHFMGMGYSKLNLDLSGISSYNEMVEMVADAVSEAEPGEWIVGRGWHQSKWEVQPDTLVEGFQTHQRLSAVSPNNPVYLSHASGHAGFANARAMELAGVLQLDAEGMEGMEIEGGEILRDDLGNPTGIFSERAQGLIRRQIPENSPETDMKAFRKAVENSYENGITGFHDAGVGRETIRMYQNFRESDSLGIRLYVMLTGWDPELLDEWYDRGPLIDSMGWLTIRSIKLNCDGALGNRGAWLLEPYTDRAGHYGHETLPMTTVEEVSAKGLEHGFQVCSHAIGDRANQEILDRYEQAFTNNPSVTDHRFRIEHAQHLHPDDIPRFGELGVIPAMQAIHMASDRPWAIDRLGEKRIVEGAYVWKKLLDSGARIVNGTDVPVEPIDPIASFYASVARKTLAGTPPEGYEPDQRMSREEALRSYTLDAAYGAFMEDIVGSIENGKKADFTVFTMDLMEVPENEILDSEVAMTILDGKVVYEKQ